MMSVDGELLDDFFERVADKWSAAELVELLEDAGVVTVWSVIAAFSEQLIEVKEKLEL